MTVFYKYVEVPADVRAVWEIDPADDDGRPWIRAEGGELWSVQGEEILHGGLVLTWKQLLDDFGPLTDDPTMAGIGLDALPSKPTLAEQIVDELRRAADKLTAEPHCGGKYSDCACDFAEQLAALFRDLADKPVDVPASALDMARRINTASGAISAASVEAEVDRINRPEVSR